MQRNGSELHPGSVAAGSVLRTQTKRKARPSERFPKNGPCCFLDRRSVEVQGCLLAAEVHHVNVDAETGIVGEVPAWVVRVGIEDDVVGIPEPAIAISNVGRSDTEEEAAEAEAGRTAATETPDLSGADRAGEAAMLPRMVEVIGPGVWGVTHPAAVTGVNVRRGRMTGLIRMTFRQRCVGCWTVRGDVTATDGRAGGADGMWGRVAAGARVRRGCGMTAGWMACFGVLREGGDGEEGKRKSCENCPGASESVHIFPPGKTGDSVQGSWVWRSCRRMEAPRRRGNRVQIWGSESR